MRQGPPLDPGTLLRPAAAASIRVGTAGWTYPDWEGIVYPAGSRTHLDRLTWMAQFVDILEINSTFYRAPLKRDALFWIKRVAPYPDFRFSVKLEKVFTHQLHPAPAGAEKRFKDGIEPIAAAGRLAAILVQFPISFKNQPDNRRRLARLLARFGEYPLAVEVRHRSWLDASFKEFLSGRGVALAGIDQPAIGACILPALPRTTSFFYVRLHGRNKVNWFRRDAGRDARYDYLYSPLELAPWLKWIKQAASQGRSGIVIANNHYRGQAAANAVEMRAALRQSKVKAPDSLIRTFPHLMGITEPLETPAPEGQTRLF